MGRRSGSQTRSVPLRWGDKERQVGGALQEEQERSRGRLSYPLGPREPAELPGRSPPPPNPPPGHVGPGVMGGRLGRSGEAGRRGPSGEEWRVIAPPTRAQEACWAPRRGPLPSETRGGGHAWAPSVH